MGTCCDCKEDVGTCCDCRRMWGRAVTAGGGGDVM